MAKLVSSLWLTFSTGLWFPVAVGQSSEEIVIDWLRTERASLLDVGNLKLQLYLQKELSRAIRSVSRNDLTVYFDPAARKIIVARTIYLQKTGEALSGRCRDFINEIRTRLGVDVERGRPRLPYESRVGEIYVPPELLTVKVGREIEKTIDLYVTVETEDSEYACGGPLVSNRVTGR